jgi:hypothetical protein
MIGRRPARAIGPLNLGQRLGQHRLLYIDEGQVQARLWKIPFQLERLQVLLERAFVATREVKCASQGRADDERERIELLRQLQPLDRLIGPTHRGEKEAIVMMSGSVARVQLDGERLARRQEAVAGRAQERVAVGETCVGEGVFGIARDRPLELL